jgi:hypothetical protein
MQDIGIASIGQHRFFRLGPYSNRNIAVLLRLLGPLDREALARALDELVVRHPMLRTTFTERDGRLWQVVGDAQRSLPPDMPAVVVDPAALDAAVRGLVDQPFKLEGESLLRVALLATGLESHVLALVMHHALGDGWSCDVISRELRELYDAHAHRRPVELSPVGASFLDFAREERPRISSPSALAEWRDLFRAGPRELALPLVDHPVGKEILRPTQWMVSIDADPGARLRALARSERVTLTTVLLAAVTRTFAPYASGHLTFNVEFVNRPGAQYCRTVGPFAANVALRMACEHDGLRNALRRARGEWLDALTRWVWLEDLTRLVEAEPSWPARSCPLVIDVNHAPAPSSPSMSAHGSLVIESFHLPRDATGERIRCPQRAAAFGVMFSEGDDGGLHIGMYWQDGRLPTDLCRSLAAAVGENLMRFAGAARVAQ